MLAIHPEYVVNEKQHRKAVILPLQDWDMIVEELEELHDIKACGKLKSNLLAAYFPNWRETSETLILLYFSNPPLLPITKPTASEKYPVPIL